MRMKTYPTLSMYSQYSNLLGSEQSFVRYQRRKILRRKISELFSLGSFSRPSSFSGLLKLWAVISYCKSLLYMASTAVGMRALTYLAPEMRASISSKTGQAYIHTLIGFQQHTSVEI